MKLEPRHAILEIVIALILIGVIGTVFKIGQLTTELHTMQISSPVDQKTDSVDLQTKISILNILKPLFRTLENIEVHRSIPGWYEVLVNSDSVYVDEKLQYAFKGELLDLKNKTNLSYISLANRQFTQDLLISNAFSLSSLETGNAESLANANLSSVQRPHPDSSVTSAGVHDVEADQSTKYNSLIGVRQDGIPMTDDEKNMQLTTLLASLSEDYTINYPAKNPIGAIYVFTDPTCEICRKLHRDILELNDNGVSVKYLFYPRSLNAGLTDRSQKEIDNIQNALCSASPESVVGELYEGKDIAENACSDQNRQLATERIMEHFILGQLFGVTGTPMIITSKGTIFGGYSTVSDIVSSFHF